MSRHGEHDDRATAEKSRGLATAASELGIRTTSGDSP